MVVVNTQQILHIGLVKVPFPIEAFGVDIIFQILQDFNRLVRKTVEFGFGKIKPVVVSRKEVIDENQYP